MPILVQRNNFKTGTGFEVIQNHGQWLALILAAMDILAFWAELAAW
jgi:hypothetical protein